MTERGKDGGVRWGRKCNSEREKMQDKEKTEGGVEVATAGAVHSQQGPCTVGGEQQTHLIREQAAVTPWNM